MKFRIDHKSKFIGRGIHFPWIAEIVILAVYLILGANVKDVTETLILIYITAILGIIQIAFILLFIGEKIFGTKIIVGTDNVDVRTLLRGRKIYFDEIDDMKYTHYECSESTGERPRHFKYLFVRYTAPEERTWVRAELIFYLSSGRTIRLNGSAPGYEQKRKLWITEPDLDPDEDVPLYKAYLCCRSARRQFYLS